MSGSSLVGGAARRGAALPLPPDAVAKAAQAALSQASRHFKAINVQGARILSSSLGELGEAFLRHQQRRVLIACSE